MARFWWCVFFAMACGGKTNDDLGEGDTSAAGDSEIEDTDTEQEADEEEGEPADAGLQLVYLGVPVGFDTSESSGIVSYDLGPIKGSREFQFLLRSSGEAPVTDIEIKSSNEAFVVDPGAISLLSAETEESFSPVIRLSAIHGTVQNGQGTTSTMPMGVNTTTLSVVGQTQDADGGAQEVKAEVFVEVEAQLMDPAILCDGQEMDLVADRAGTTSSSLGGIGWLPIYRCAGDRTELSNRGNVDVVLNWVTLDGELVASIDVPVGQKETVRDTTNSGPSDYEYLKIDGDNAVSQEGQLAIGTDGSAYMILVTGWQSDTGHHGDTAEVEE